MFAGLPAEIACWMSHGDSVVEVPPGFRGHRDQPATCRWPPWPTPGCGLYGVQFHPEVRHTEYGQDILKNFLYTVCDIAPTWTPVSIIEEAVERIRAQVGDERVVCGLSGGVDSAVAALLVYKAVGDQLTCIFVDHGLMRKDEGDQVENTFRRHFHVPLVHVRAQERFVGKLAGVTEPEHEAQDHRRGVHPHVRGRVAQAGQGQVPGAGHHLPRRHRVGHQDRRPSSSRTTTWAACPTTSTSSWWSRCACCSRTRCGWWARSWACPRSMVWRQPFPGPGLAIRIIGEVTEERLDILREADAILLDEVKRAGLYREFWQSFAVLPAIRSVGVMGDERTYAYPIVIRAVTSDDAMTADWARLPYDLLERHLAAHHQRGARGQPGGAGHLQQASFDHRMGVEKRSEYDGRRICLKRTSRPRSGESGEAGASAGHGASAEPSWSSSTTGPFWRPRRRST